MINILTPYFKRLIENIKNSFLNLFLTLIVRKSNPKNNLKKV